MQKPPKRNLANLSKAFVQNLLGQFGYGLRKVQKYCSYSEETAILPEALQWLRRDNPELLDLRRRYGECDLPVVIPSTWWSQDRLADDIKFAYFRGDNAYVYAYRDDSAQLTRMRFYLFARYMAARDPRGLLQKLGEDGAFGCWRYHYQGLPPVSRDLLDSVNEIYFLDRHFKLFDRPDTRILDIGAGYGRMAHRMLHAVPTISRYYCADAIPDSTFLCDFYIKHRKVNDRAVVVPLDRFASTMQPDSVDLAMNIHSFSECTLEAITWWLEQLVRLRVPYFLLIPNDPDDLLSRETDDSRKDFRPVMERLGFVQIATELIYQEPGMVEFMPVNDRILLFRGPATV